MSATQTFGGIFDQFAGPSSFVNEVRMQDLNETGLMIATDGSGPYTNITYIAVSGSCSGMNFASPRCVDIEAQTQGLHGITCLGDQQTAATTGGGGPGIVVNASNNSIKDAHVEAFWDGVAIADPASTSSLGNINVSNIYGGHSNNCGSTAGFVTNVVHLCGPNAKQEACHSASGAVTNVTILQAANEKPTLNTVLDDVTGTVIASCGSPGCSLPLTTAMYSLGGNQVGSTGGLSYYPLFATNR